MISPTVLLRVALVVTLPAAAVAQDIEVFGDVPGCALLTGEPVATDGLMIYDALSIIRAEAVCPVEAVQQVGSGATLLTVSCSGEGESWEDYYMIETTAEADRLVIYPSDFPDARTEVTRCF